MKDDCVETINGVGTIGVWESMYSALMWYDTFQTLGVPCWLSPALLDNPYESDEPYAEEE